MKTQVQIWLVMLALGGWTAQGGLYTAGLTPNAVIPDGNASGYQSSLTLSGLPSAILDVNVTLNISGGWNGDIYAYLRHGDGFSVLLNRVGTPDNYGFGYGDTGFHVTLDGQATQSVDIHLYQNVSYTLN